MTLDSQSPDLHEALLAAAYYSITNHGAIGGAIDEMLIAQTPLSPKKPLAVRSPQSAPTGIYRIVDRCESDFKITVRLVHTEQATPKEQADLPGSSDLKSDFPYPRKD